MDIEFIGYVIKIGNYYFGGRTQNSISVYKNKNIKEMSKKLESEFWYDFKNWKELN